MAIDSEIWAQRVAQYALTPGLQKMRYDRRMSTKGLREVRRVDERVRRREREREEEG